MLSLVYILGLFGLHTYDKCVNSCIAPLFNMNGTTCALCCTSTGVFIVSKSPNHFHNGASLKDVLFKIAYILYPTKIAYILYSTIIHDASVCLDLPLAPMIK